MKKLLVAAALVVLASCGPKPLSVWRVSGVSGEATCTPAPTTAPLVTTTTTPGTARQVDMGTWELYEGPQTDAGEQRFYLTGASSGKNGGLTLEGGLKDGVYTFNWTTETVSKDKSDAPTRTQTDTVTNTISITDKGSTFEGTWSASDKHVCAGSNCEANFSETHRNCDSTTQLRGAQVDTNMEHQL